MNPSALSTRRPSDAPVRVLVVDDQKLFADALALFLAYEDRIEVVGVAESGQEAIDLALANAADVVLMDLFMPRMDGLEATKRLHSIRPETHVIVLSGLGDDDAAQRAREAGADAYLQKGRVHEQVVEAILAAAGKSAFQGSDPAGSDPSAF
jgi:DNA-binding NarL/FixJ family response regulator